MMSINKAFAAPTTLSWLDNAIASYLACLMVRRFAYTRIELLMSFF